jgi:hypothetical protein
MRTFPRSCNNPATPKARTSRADISIHSASAIVSTDTFNEWVVVYWSKSFNCSSGSTIALSPCIATESDRTTDSASSNGSSPRTCTSS